MKRSEINQALREMEEMVCACGFALPPFCYFTPEEWENGELDSYAAQAALAAHDTLMINPIDLSPRNYGGSFRFRDGKLMQRLPFDSEQILIVDVQ